jgi:uridine phosphorylase
MNGSPEKISEYVLFSGDPWRVNTVRKYLDNIEEVAFAREFNTLTGCYGGIRVTVTSTGIGAPSAAIAMEEMYECGMRCALRMGTVMALDNSMLGNFIIPIASIRRENTSLNYAEAGYPAVADIEFVNVLNEVADMFGKRYQNGISCTMDGFYTHMRESRFSRESVRDLNAVFDGLDRMNVSGIDMESSCMLTIGRLMGVKTAVITVATVLRNLSERLDGERREQADEMLCVAALEGISRFAKKQKGGKKHE